MKGAKKDKKNGKDGGGVVAAVTKHAAGKSSYVDWAFHSLQLPPEPLSPHVDVVAIHPANTSGHEAKTEPPKSPSQTHPKTRPLRVSLQTCHPQMSLQMAILLLRPL